MPCLNVTTNVSLDGVDTSSILSEATTTVANLVGKPEAVCFSSSFCFAILFMPWQFEYETVKSKLGLEMIDVDF